MPIRTANKYTREGVRNYEKRRYRGLDQRLVHALEIKLLNKAFRRIDHDRAGQPVGRGCGEKRRALDLPSGYGRFTTFLSRRELSVFNSDLSLEMVRRAWEVSGVPGAVADAVSGLPFKDGCFETVLTIRLFHHLHNPAERAAVLSELRRVTSKWAVVSFYRMSGLHAAQRHLQRKFGKRRVDIKMIEPGQFEEEASSAGFDIIDIRPLIRGLHAYHLALLKRKEV
jgi:SAM-dependent methyltransferase